MGAWTFAEPRLRDGIGNGITLRYCGRPDRASPAEGYEATHKREQARIIAEATTIAAVKVATAKATVSKGAVAKVAQKAGKSAGASRSVKKVAGAAVKKAAKKPARKAARPARAR